MRAHLRSTRRTHAALDLEAPDLSECAKGNVDLCSLVRPYLEKVLGFFVLDQVCGAQPLTFHISACHCEHASARTRVPDALGPPTPCPAEDHMCSIRRRPPAHTDRAGVDFSYKCACASYFRGVSSGARCGPPPNVCACTSYLLPAPVCASLARAWRPQHAMAGKGSG